MTQQRGPMIIFGNGFLAGWLVLFAAWPSPALGSRFGAPTRVATLTPRLTSISLVAQRDAERLHEEPVTAEHLMAALLWEGQGVAAQIVSAADPNGEIAGAVALARRSSSGHFLTADALLVRAAADAERRSHDFVGTEHVLAVLLSEPGSCPAAAVIAASRARDEIARGIGAYFDSAGR